MQLKMFGTFYKMIRIVNNLKMVKLKKIVEKNWTWKSKRHKFGKFEKILEIDKIFEEILKTDDNENFINYYRKF